MYRTDHSYSRGTSTYDGIAIASAVLHHLSTHTLALSCFATHYSMLTEDYRYHPNIRTMHMATAFDDDQRAVRRFWTCSTYVPNDVCVHSWSGSINSSKALHLLRSEHMSLALLEYPRVWSSVLM